jgi:tyrosine-protein kinase Etk/Wzc
MIQKNPLEKFTPIDNGQIEGIDTDKLLSVVRKNKWWILSLFLVCNLLAYLTIRWTKDLFESQSEMKLDIKRDAAELGIKTVIEDQNVNMIAGEIEQIKSKVFFDRVIDSLDIQVSYYSIGNVLKDEMYKRSPYLAYFKKIDPALLDKPIYFDFIDNETFKLRLNNTGSFTEGNFGKPISLNGSEFVFTVTKFYEPSDANDYYFIVNSRATLINYLSTNSKVEPLNFNANTISVSFQDNNSLKAYDIVNRIDSLYIAYSNEQKNLANRQKIEWLNNELSQVEKRMQNFESYFENFTLQNKSSDLGQDLKKTIIAINHADSQRFQLTKKITLLNEAIDGINSGKIAISYQQRSFLPDYLNKKLEDLSRMQQERDQLGLAYNENTFAFRQKEKEMSSLKELVYGQLAELKREWLKILAELGQTKARLEKEFATMPDKNTQFSKNQRFYKLYEEFYLSMMQSKAQFEIARAGNTPDFKILSHATLPTVPISPKRYLVLGIGLVAGIVLNFFFIGIVYLINNKITSTHEVEKAVSVPILGVIPVSNRKSISEFHVIDNPKSMVSESIRSLRTNLDFFTAGGNKKIITITSTISGEGKSFLAANLGGVLAMSRKKVLLIDLDMRKQKNKSYLLAEDPSKGISTVLIKKTTWRECIQKTNVEHLYFMPAGPHPPNPSELLLNGEFTSLLEELKAEYDFIVIDTPPVGLVTDGIMAMKRSDLSIYVVRANYSKKEFLNNLNRLTSIHRLTGLAVVLNALPSSSKSYGYGYYEDSPQQKDWKNLFKA